MSLLTYIALAAYAVPSFIGARLIAGHVAYAHAAAAERTYPRLHRGDTGHPRLYQWLSGAVCGLVAGVVWPVVVLIIFACRAIPAERWAVGAESAAIKRQREERIQDLERELNLR